jgi:eukaryotic-like serine/threonine-protein kinase
MGGMTDAATAKTLVEEKERVSLGRTSDEALAPTPLEPRYREVTLLGEGGMGEVKLVRDGVVGRDVALKRIRGVMGLDAYARERFLREARVQGQLEHSSIVPVYDLAMTPDHRLFFTMRRVRGRTLDECATGNTQLTRHALLSAMSRVCLAVDFAHSRGVVHRDIKPANIMIGDYGEVYVLDWGLAKLTGSTHDPAHPSGPLPSSGDSHSGKTTAGSVLGTPGFMAPEQARGNEVDARTDVYALGACLFEVLAGKPLIDLGPLDGMMTATFAGVNARLRDRAPDRDVPVELETICVRATETERDARFPTARAMSDAIERFLEGDRDLERRRARAREHATTAGALAEAAFAETGDTERARKDAMREVGRALANDPDNADARRVLVRLLTEPPRTIPQDVNAQMAADLQQRIVTARRFAAVGFLSTLVPQALAAWAGIADLGWYVFSGACAIAGAAAVIFPTPDRRSRSLIVAFIGLLGLVTVARIASPLILVPTMAMGLGAGLILFPRKISVAAGVLLVVGCLVVPLALEWLGIVPRTFHIEPDRIIIEARVVHWRETPTLVWFFVATLTPIIATFVYLAHVRDRLVEAEQRIRLQAWQLRQILPDA